MTHKQAQPWFESKWFIALLLGAILVVAVAFRFWHLGTVPPGLYMDEAVNGNDAIEVMETGEYESFYFGNYGREGLYVNIMVQIFKVFGVGVWQLRAVGALAGVLTVLGLYFVTKEVLNRRVALIATFLMASSFWHVLYNRIGYRANLTPLFLVWGLYLFMRALRTRSFPSLVGFAVVYGVGFYTYIAYRASVLVILAVFGMALWQWKKEHGSMDWKALLVQRQWWRWAVAAGVVIVMLIPLLQDFVQYPQEFLMRPTMVSVFDDTGGNPVWTTIKNTVKTAGMFHYAGDPQWRHNIAGDPMLIWPVGLLFLLGLMLVASKKWSGVFALDATKRTLLFSWLFVMMLPSFVSKELIPYSLRSIGAIPVVYMFAGIGGAFVWRMLAGAQYRAVVQPLVVFMLLLIPLVQWYRYFEYWGPHPETRYAFVEHHVDLARIIRELPSQQQKYVVVDLTGNTVDGLPIASQSLMFLLHDVSNVHFVTEADAAVMNFAPEDAVISLYDFEVMYRTQIGKTMQD